MEEPTTDGMTFIDEVSNTDDEMFDKLESRIKPVEIEFNPTKEHHLYEKWKEKSYTVPITKIDEETGVETILYEDAPLQMEEAYNASGALLWRKINGHNVTPPGELIKEAHHVIQKSTMTKEEYESFWGKLLISKAEEMDRKENAEMNNSIMSRADRRQRQQMGKKIIKKIRLGHTPRQIAHELGYININQGEQEINKFISVINQR